MLGKVSDDGNVWIGGFTGRMNPDGTNVTIIGHNYRNSYEQTVNSFGDLYQSDNDALASLPRHADHGREETLDLPLRTGCAPGVRINVPARTPLRQNGVRKIPDHACGRCLRRRLTDRCCLLRKRSAWRQVARVTSGEAGKNVVFGYQPQPDGAGFKLDWMDFLTSNKEKEFAGSDFLGGRANGELKTKFRPSDVCVGPDGALYVADWFDARVGGHGTMDDGMTGAIYRIAPRASNQSFQKLI